MKFPQQISFLSEVLNTRWIQNFDVYRFSTTFSELCIKRMSIEKNVVGNNLFAIKLSSEKILNQFFVRLQIAEKIAGNWENLDLAYFWSQKSRTESVIKTTTSQLTCWVRSDIASLSLVRHLVYKRDKLCECFFPMWIRFHSVQLSSAYCVQSSLGWANESIALLTNTYTMYLLVNETTVWLYKHLWLYSITNVIWTAITDKKYIESNAACWRQHLSDIWAVGIKLSVIVDTYTYLCCTDKKTPIV